MGLPPRRALAVALPGLAGLAASAAVTWNDQAARLQPETEVAGGEPPAAPYYYPQQAPYGYPPQPAWGYPPPAAPAPMAMVRPPYRQHVEGSTPTGKIWIGTPPVSMEVIFDTGSDKLLFKSWETVSREMAKVDAGMSELIMPSNKIYSHNISTTYAEKFTTSGGKKVPKHGFIAYGSGQAMTEEGSDDVWVGGHRLHGFPVSEITADSLTILHRKKGAGGVLGLQHMKNRSSGESIFTRLREMGMVNAFGYCRGKKEDTGTFIWGDSSTDGHPVEVIGNIHWAVRLSDVKVPDGTPPAAARPRNGGAPPFPLPPFGGARGPASAPDRFLDEHQGRDTHGSAAEDPFGFGGADDKADPFGFGDAVGSRQDQNDEEDPFAHIPGHRAVQKAGHHFRAHGSSLGEEGQFEIAAVSPAADEDEGPAGGTVIIEPIEPDAPTASNDRADQEPMHWSDLVDNFVEEFSKGELGPAGEALLEVDGRPKARSQTMDWSRLVEQIAHMLKPKVAKMPLCSGQPCTAIIDTGSNIIAGPPAGIEAIKQLASVKFDCSNVAQLPHLYLTLGSKPITLSPSSYVMKVKLPSWARPLAHRLSLLSRSQAAADGTSLAEVEAREAFLNPWALTLEHLQRKYGIDLGSGLARDMEEMASLDKLCLPAFVPIDIKTPIGQLWVVGTPLFENYYTRWSWQQGDPAPKIFLEDLHSAQACQEQAAPQAPQQQPRQTQQPYAVEQPVPYHGQPVQPAPYYGYPQPQPYYGRPPQPYYAPQPYQQPTPPQGPYYSQQQPQASPQQQQQPQPFYPLSQQPPRQQQQAPYYYYPPPPPQPYGARRPDQPQVPARLMRAEGRPRTQASAEPVSMEEVTIDIPELEIDEIRFPHWAMSLTEL